MPDAEQVVEANLKFYFALESLDIGLMDEVWATDSGAVCVHPGWSRLIGWETIRTSWEQIFSNSTYMRVDLSDVTVDVKENVAWVTCMENISSATTSDNRRARAFATNIFVYEDDRWLLVVHHTSLVMSAAEAS